VGVYILRRMIAAVLLLLIVTAATFVVFFLVPRLAGATPDDLASRYVGRTASPQVIHQIAINLGFTDPMWVQYGRFVKGLVLGAEYSTGPTTVHCPAPCLG
jgi:peptide/nickel transport system permease protein